MSSQIGNAVLNDETDQLGMVEYAWSHAIISDELHSAVTRECDYFREEAVAYAWELLTQVYISASSCLQLAPSQVVTPCVVDSIAF